MRSELIANLLILLLLPQAPQSSPYRGAKSGIRLAIPQAQSGCGMGINMSNEISNIFPPARRNDESIKMDYDRTDYLRDKRNVEEEI